MEPEKSLVAATHQRDQARAELRRIEQQFASERAEIARLHADAEAARMRAADARREHALAVQSREAAETEGAQVSGRLAQLRQDFQALQEHLVARREELATMSERLSSAESAEQHLIAELTVAGERMASLQQQHAGMLLEKTELESSCEQLGMQVEELRKEKTRLEELKAAQETQLLAGEELIAAETNYNEMKARVDAMGPVNMMALEEFKECEERDTFL